MQLTRTVSKSQPGDNRISCWTQPTCLVSESWSLESQSVIKGCGCACWQYGVSELTSGVALILCLDLGSVKGLNYYPNTTHYL